MKLVVWGYERKSDEGTNLQEATRFRTHSCLTHLQYVSSGIFDKVFVSQLRLLGDRRLKIKEVGRDKQNNNLNKKITVEIISKGCLLLFDAEPINSDSV